MGIDFPICGDAAVAVWSHLNLPNSLFQPPVRTNDFKLSLNLIRFLIARI